MSVSPSSIPNPLPKYKGALAIRSVTGGQTMNVLTVPGVANEPFKGALESSLAQSGYLAHGNARYQIDAEIKNLEQPLIGLDMEVTANVTYKVTGAGTSTDYPISTKATATVSDSIVGADRVRIANERAMQNNIREFLMKLR